MASDDRTVTIQTYGWHQGKKDGDKEVSSNCIYFVLMVERDLVWANEIHIVHSLSQLEFALAGFPRDVIDAHMRWAENHKEAQLPENSEKDVQVVRGEAAMIIHAIIAKEQKSREQLNDLQKQFDTYKKMADPDGALAFFKNMFGGEEKPQ